MIDICPKCKCIRGLKTKGAVVGWKCACSNQDDDKFSRFKKFIQENRKEYTGLGLVQAWIREFESKEEGQK